MYTNTDNVHVNTCTNELRSDVNLLKCLAWNVQGIDTTVSG